MTTPKQTDQSDTHSKATSFTAVAPYYDELMAGVPYRFWVEYVTSLLRAHNRNPRTILDLACGTGSAAIELARRGFDVVGVDLSAAMIDVARQKAEAAGCDIKYYDQDAADLLLIERFDTVVSLFDSLNNIVEPGRLALAFVRVYDHLSDSGCFVFDMNTEYAFTAGMFNQKSHPIDGPLQYVWRSKYDQETRLCTVRMDFTVPSDTGELLKFEEVHLQRAYGKDEITCMLSDAGFESITVYDAYTHKPPKKRSDRLFFVAIKGPAPKGPPSPALRATPPDADLPRPQAATPPDAGRGQATAQGCRTAAKSAVPEGHSVQL